MYGRSPRTRGEKLNPDEKKIYEGLYESPVMAHDPLTALKINERESDHAWEEAMESKLLFKEGYLPIMTKKLFITD